MIRTNIILQKRRWHSQWIWKRGEDALKNSYYLFRKEFALDAVPSDARLFISACTRYELFVNGAFVGRGPTPGQPYHQFYDAYDIAAHLKRGENTVGLIVNFTGIFEGTRGGVILEIAGGGKTLLESDSSWKTARALSWRADTFRIATNMVACYQEHFDARVFPRGWNRPSFNDDAWEKAEVVSDIGKFTTLVPRDIPFMRESMLVPAAIAYTEECLDIANRQRGDDLSICLSAAGSVAIVYSTIINADAMCRGERAEVMCSTRHLDGVFDGIHDPCIVLDFGRVITARPRLEISGPEGGMVDIGYAERLIDGRFNNAIEGQFADRYIMKGGEESWQPFAWKGFRYLKLRFRSCFAPVRISVTAIITAYPFEDAGGFSSTDEMLNRIFEISRETIKLCSNDSLVDTPWREQAQWLGDVAAVTLPGIYSCFGDAAPAAKFIRQSAANLLPTGLIANMTNAVDMNYKWVIPDFSLWWVIALWNHYEFTGDAAWVHEFYPHALRILQAHEAHLNEFGLVEEMPYWVFIDWADVDRRGECAAYNAIFHGALDALRKMAIVKADTYTGEKISGMRARLEMNFQARLFDEHRGVVSDARIQDVLSEKASEHSSLAAIRFGLLDARATESVVSHFYTGGETRFTEAQPFFMSVVLPALVGIGRMDIALRLMRERWGERMVARGFTSTLEEWYQNGSWRSGEFNGFLRTHSHAWSAYPAEFLIRALAGFEIVAPGCATVRLAPHETPFDYHVSIPTARGNIEVRKSAGKAAEISVPEEIQVEGRERT